MNKIYKVVWSKVKNCYVVVSEIAKNVLTGGVKSAKVGCTPVVKGMALGAFMAFLITGNAWAAGNYQYADYKGEIVTITGNLNVVGTGNNAYGIDAEESTITLGSNGAVVKFDLTATANGGEAVAVWGNTGSTIDIVADNFEIKTSGAETGSLQANGGTQITVTANEADISGVIWAGGEGSTVDLTQVGDLRISDSNGYPVIQVDNKGAVIVGSYDGKTVVTGDIYANNDGAVGMILGTADSSFTGAIKTDGVGGAVLDLKDGATWYVTDDSSIGSLIGNEMNIVAADGAEDVKVTLECDNHDIDIHDDYETTTVNIQGVDFSLNEDNDDGLSDGIKIVSDSDLEVNVAAEHGIVINGDGNVDVEAENITVDSYKAAVWVDDTGTGTVNINASENVGLNSEDRFAVNNESVNGGVINITGKNVNIVSENRTAIKTGGVLGRKGKNGVVNVSGENISVQGAAQEDVAGNEHNASVVYAQGGTTINLSATNEITITDTQKVGGNSIIAYEGSAINVDGKNIIVDNAIYSHGKANINLTGTDSINISVVEDDNDTVAVSSWGRGNVVVDTKNLILVAQNTSDVDPAGSIQAHNGATVTVEANTADITGVVYAGNTETYEYQYKAVVDLSSVDDITIRGTGTVPVIQADKNGVVSVGDTDSKTNIDGDIYAYNGGEIRVAFGENSTFTGVAQNSEGVLAIDLNNGATWNVAGDSTITNLTGTGGNVINTTGEVITLNVVNYGDNDQHDGEGRFSGATLTNENLIINGVNLIVDTWETAIYNNNVKIDSDSDVSINSKHDDGICVYGNVEINGKNVVITANDNGIKSADADKEDGNNNGTQRLEDGNVTINATGDVTVKSVETGEGYAITNVSENGGKVEIKANGKVELASYDRPAIRVGEFYDGRIFNGVVDVTGEIIEIQGVARTHDEGEFEPSVAYAKGAGKLNLTATNAITITDTANLGGNAVGAYDGGVVNIKNATDVVLDGKVYANGEDAVVNFDNVENITITSTQGSAVNNASNSSVINIGDEQTRTVTITGKTEGSREVFDNQGNFVNYNEDNRAVIYSKGTVNITAKEKVVINDTGVKTKALSAYGDANITIDGGKQTIINGEITADGYGPVLQSDGNVEHQDNGIADNINVLIKGKEIIVDASLEAEEGIFARGDSTGIDNAVITVGDVNTEKVIVRDVDTGLFAWNGGSKVEVNSDSLVISADGNFNDSAMGICAYNESADGNKLAVIDVNANKTEITVEDGAFAYGVLAEGKSSVNVSGDIDIIANGTSAFGVNAKDNAVVELGNANSDVTFNVNADELDYSGESRAEAIAARENNVVKVLGNMIASVNGRDWVSGVESEDNSVVELGNVVLDVSTNGNEFSEASGINAARKGTVKVNGDLDAAVTGGEWATGVEAGNGSSIYVGNGSSEVNLSASAKGNMSKDEDWAVSAIGILSVGRTNPIVGENGEVEKEAYGGSTVNFNAAKLTVSATADNGLAYGVYAEDDGAVNANGNVDITATGYSAHGIEVRENSTVQLGAIGKDVSITATSTGEAGEAIAVYAGEYSNVNIVADTLDVNIQSIYDGGSLQAKRGSTIYVNANNASVHGIVRATKNAVVNLADANNLKLTSDYLEEYGITPVLEADVGGNVIVGNTTGKTEIIGDVFAHDGGQVDIILATAGSVLEGTTNIKLPEGVPNEDGSNEEGIVNLTLSNGATWSSFDDSYVTTLTMVNGVVKMFGNGQTITVDSLNGIGDSDATGTILVTDFSNRLDVNKADKGSTLTVAYDGTYETIVDKKALILESNEKLDDIVIGDGADNINVNKNVEIHNTSVLGTYSLSSDGSLNARIDADNLLVGGNVQAATFNGINLVEALDSKADKSTTLAGYGITDAYTKAEVNAKLEDIANVSIPDINIDELQHKTQNISTSTTANETVITGNVEISGNVNAKTFNGIDLSTLSTKAEVSNAINQKADKKYVDDELKDVAYAYQAADKTMETKVTNAYKAADNALETKVVKAYKAEDAVLSSRITENEKSITALENSISKIGTSGDNAYKAADKTLETNVTKAYQAADKALESKVTKAYQAADKALESKVTKEYQAADKALESKLTKDYKAEDAALEIRLSDEYKLADTVVETKLTDAYQAADAALELKVTNAYQAADAKLSSRIEATENSISALSSNIVGMEDGYKYLDTELEAKITDAYQTADVALEDKVTKAYESADKALETKVTKAYQSADKALESKVTKAYQSADKALETKVTKAYQSADKALETKVTKAYQSADKALETKVTKAYQAADKALENQIKNMQAEDKALESRVTKAYMAADAALQSEVTKAYQAADKALEVEFTGLINGKADKATTLKGYGITDAYTKTEVEKMLKYTGDDEDIEELKNKTQNISEYTTEGITIVNGSIQVFGNVTAQYGNFFTGATFANDEVRIDSDGVVRIGGSGNDANVVIYNEGTTSIDAAGSVVGGALVSKGNVEASGSIISTNGDVMAGDISLRETAEAISNKADKATTLEGYGITDAYTKAEIDSKFETKVDASDVYTKSDVDSKLADVSAELSGKADTAYVDSNFAKVDDVYTKEEADATFVKRTEVITVDENGNLVAGTKTEIGENFVVENTSNGSTVTINEGQKGQVVIGDDGKVIFGQHSAWYEDGVGFFVGRTELTKGHDKDNANAAIMDDGRLMAAGGKFTVETDGSISAAGGNFTVDADGDVKAKTYNGIELDKFVQNSQEEISGLNQRLGKLSGKVNKVGAGAAALAALHPLEYDPDDKLTFSAGVGNYSGTNAAAIGAFYRPDEKFMVSLGGTMGNDENMANLGISIGLAGTKGSPKLSKKELLQVMSNMVTKNNAVRLENQTIKADNEAIKAENENIKAEVAELKALVAELLAKK